MTAASDPNIETKLASLHAHLESLGSVVVCYSGGVDSAFLLAAAHRALGAKAIGLTAVSPSLAPGEIEEATSIAKQIGADHRVVESREIDDPDYQKNAPNRCFYCKTELYGIAEKKRVEWGVAHVLNGTNVDDLGDYRPGLEAASNASVKSPLVELGFDKAAVRAGAAAFGLPVWDKPAAACLSSRIPFGTSVTRERLNLVGGFELALKKLGFRQVRVRYHGLSAPTAGVAEKALARVELDVADLARAAEPTLREAIVLAGKTAGFAFVTLDLAGYRMGSQNELLEGRSLRVIA